MRKNAAVLAGLIAVPVLALAQAPSDATVAAHVAEAQRLAGSDLKPLLVLCKPAPAKRAPQAAIDQRIGAEMARAAPPPGKAFDNLYYVGAAWVSAWAIRTQDGIILIDALNNNDEAAALVDGGLRKLGLDPAQIKYVVVTHAHGDHYGGATHFVEKYKSRVVASEVDWQQMEKGVEVNSSHWGPVPRREVSRGVSLDEGGKLTLGGETLTAHITPGHTHGTLTPTFDVTSGGKKHRVLLWGGTAFNFGDDLSRLDTYIEATERMAKLAEAQGIDVMLSNHAGYDESLSKLEKMRAQGSMEPNPFVIGTPAVARGLRAMGECAKAQRDRFAMQK
jgi:metallo-beta-lactamase class B